MLRGKIVKLKAEFEPLTMLMKKVFGDQIQKLSVCDRLVDSPCVFTTSEYCWSANLERIRKLEPCTQKHLIGCAYTHIFLVRTPQRIIRTFPV